MASKPVCSFLLISSYRKKKVLSFSHISKRQSVTKQENRLHLPFHFMSNISSPVESEAPRMVSGSKFFAKPFGESSDFDFFFSRLSGGGGEGT